MYASNTREKMSKRLGKTFSGSYDPRYNMSRSDESRQESSNHSSFREISADFAELTSMHGINYIHLSRRLWLKLLWFLIVLAGCGVMVLNLHYLCTIYFGYPKQTKIELGFDSLSFPAITVCNINPIRSSMLKESGPLMHQLMQETSTSKQINILTRSLETSQAAELLPAGTASVGRTTGKRYLDVFPVNVNYTNPYTGYQDVVDDDPWAREANRTTESRIEQEFDALFGKMKRDKRIAVGHQLKDFVVQCSFAGRTVPNENFKIHQSPAYGNCFTLQYKDFLSRRSGPTDGLEMVLFLENEEYLRGWTNGNGAHLVVHDLDTVPLIDQDGVAVAGGTETFIGIRRVNIERKGSPYGKCDDGTNYRNLYNVSYTRQVCQDFCRVQLVVQKCSCFDTRHDETNRILKLLDNNHGCRTSSEIKCLVQLERDYEAGRYNSDCICENPCKETKFEKVQSSRQWPSFEYGKVLVEAICFKSDDSTCRKLRAYDGFRLSSNFIKLNIFYEDLNYENITEDADYADAQFLSDVGGTLGLWIGLSVISLFEISQFITEMIGACCRCNKSG